MKKWNRKNQPGYASELDRGMDSDVAVGHLRYWRLRLVTYADTWNLFALADDGDHCWLVWEVADPDSSACCFLVGKGGTADGHSAHSSYSASAADTSAALAAGMPIVPLPPSASASRGVSGGTEEL